MRAVARGCLIALSLLLLPFPQAVGATAVSYAAGTILCVLVNVALVITWQRFDRDDRRAASRRQAGSQPAGAGAISTVALITVAVLLVYAAGERWLREVLTYPNDAQRADMLVVIEQGIRRMLQGRNPYTVYHVPWDVTLPYGPLLWAPYAVPYLLHADLRLASMLGELFV